MWTESLALSLLASSAKLHETGPITAATLNRTRHLQRVDCSNADTEIAEYVLLDIDGFPNAVTDISLPLIEESLVEAYSNVVPSSCRALDSFTIQPGAYNNTHVIAGDSDAQQFFYVGFAEGTCSDCEQVVFFDYGDTATSECTCLAPTKEVFLAEFKSVYLSRIGSVSDPLIVQDMNGLAELELQDFCTPSENTTNKFATEVFISFETTSATELTDFQKNELSDLFKQTYNLPNRDSCDMNMREIEVAYIDIVEDLDSNIIPLDPLLQNPQQFIMLYITGDCIDCDADINLFDAEDETSTALSRRRLQQLEDDFRCLCPVEAPLRASTVDEFIVRFSKAMRTSLSFEATLNVVLELEALECDTKVETFEELVIIELEVCEREIITSDIPYLESSFLKAYNDLLRNSCDDEHRKLTEVAFMRQGNMTEDGNMPIEVKVRGTCQGCDPENFSLYDTREDRIRTVIVSTANFPRRNLETGLCYCRTNAVANRGPTEAEFLDVYRELISSLDTLACVDTVEECEEADDFETVLWFVVSNKTGVFTDEAQEDFAEATLDALNNVYGTTDLVCLPEFRTFDRVDSRVNVTVSYNADDLRLDPSNGETRRILQADDLAFYKSSGRQMDEDVEPSSSPSLLPTLTASPTVMPSSSPTIGGSTGILNVLHFLGGGCNGCDNDLFSSTQAVGRRKLAEFERMLFDKPNAASSTCFCPLNSIVADESEITMEDILAAIEIELDRRNLELRVFNATEVKVAQCAEDENLYLAFATEFKSAVYVQVDIDPGTILTEQNLTQIGDQFQEEYNSANGISCNTSNFQLVSVKPYSSTPFSYILRDEDSLTYLPYEVVGYCNNCESDTLIFSNVTAPKADVIALYEPTFGPSIDLVDVIEVDVFPCGNVLTNFDQRVVVDYVIGCTDDIPSSINDSVFDTIAEAYVTAFQNLHEDYCDEEMVSVNSARVVEIGDILDGNTLPLELVLEMQCLGCNTDTTGAYSFPGKEVTTIRRYLSSQVFYSNPTSRLLQDNDGACACALDPLANRIPTEAEFIGLYQETLSDLSLGCISTAKNCDFGETFGIDKAVLLSFAEDSPFNFSEENVAILAQAFKEAVNELFTRDEDTCDIYFQTIQEVVVDTSFIYTNREIDFGAGRERSLIHESWHRKVEESSFSNSPTTVPSPSPSVSFPPSASPSVSSVPSSTPSLSLPPSTSPSLSQAPSDRPSESQEPTNNPTSMPTIRGSNFGLALLDVIGFCNGCPNDPFGANQAVRRRLGEVKEMTSVDPIARNLQDEEVESNCYCPLDKERIEGQVSLDDVILLLQEKLDALGISAVVNGAIEVTVSQCPSEVTNFESQMSFTFYALVEAIDEGIGNFGPELADTYNDLAESYCDPLYRRGLVLSEGRLTSDVPTELNRPCVPITATYSVSAECRGCVDGTSLFFDGEGAVDAQGQQRNLQSAYFDSRRHLQLDECVCLGGDARLPSEEEIAAILEEFVCDPGMTYAPTASPTCSVLPDGDEAQVLISFFLVDADGDFTAEDADTVASIIQSVVNLDNANSFDTCDSEYIQISSINYIAEADLPDFFDERVRGRRLATLPVNFEITCACTGDNCQTFCQESVQRACDDILAEVETGGFEAPSDATSSGCIYVPREICFIDVSDDATNALIGGEVWGSTDFEDETDVMPAPLVDENNLLENEAVAFDLQCTSLPCSVALSNEDAGASWFYGYDMFQGQLDQFCEQFDYLESETSLQDVVCMELEQERTTLMVRETDGVTTTGEFVVTLIDGSCRCFSGYNLPIELQEGGDDNWDTGDFVDEQLLVPSSFSGSKSVSFEIFCDSPPCHAFFNKDDEDPVMTYTEYAGRISDEQCPSSRVNRESNSLNIHCMNFDQSSYSVENARTLLFIETDSTDEFDFEMQVEAGVCTCFSGYPQPIELEEGNGDDWSTGDFEDEQVVVPSSFTSASSVVFEIFCDSPPCHAYMIKDSSTPVMTYIEFAGRITDEECSRTRVRSESNGLNVHCMNFDQSAYSVDGARTLLFVQTDSTSEFDFEIEVDDGECTCFSGYVGADSLAEGESDFINVSNDGVLLPELLFSNALVVGKAYELNCGATPCSVTIAAASGDYGYSYWTANEDLTCDEFDFVAEGKRIVSRECIELNQEETIFVVYEAQDTAFDTAVTVSLQSGVCTCFSGYGEFAESLSIGDSDFVNLNEKQLMPEALFSGSDILGKAYEFNCATPPCAMIMSISSGSPEWTYFTANEDQPCDDYVFAGEGNRTVSKECIDLTETETVFILSEAVVEAVTALTVSLTAGVCDCFSGYSDAITLGAGDSDTVNLASEGTLLPERLFDRFDIPGRAYQLLCDSPPCAVSILPSSGTVSYSYWTGNKNASCAEYVLVAEATVLESECIELTEEETILLLYGGGQGDTAISLQAAECTCFTDDFAAVETVNEGDSRQVNLTTESTALPESLFSGVSVTGKAFELLCSSPPCAVTLAPVSGTTAYSYSTANQDAACIEYDFVGAGIVGEPSECLQLDVAETMLFLYDPTLADAVLTIGLFAGECRCYDQSYQQPLLLGIDETSVLADLFSNQAPVPLLENNGTSLDWVTYEMACDSPPCHARFETAGCFNFLYDVYEHDSSLSTSCDDYTLVTDNASDFVCSYPACLDLTSPFTSVLTKAIGYNSESDFSFTVTVVAGECPCFLGYFYPIQLEVGEGNSDGSVLPFREELTPIDDLGGPGNYNSSDYLSYEVFCESPPCTAELYAGNNFDIEYVIFEHTSSYPACDDYTYINQTSYEFGSSNSNSLCLDLTSEYTTILVREDDTGCGFSCSGSLNVTIGSGFCPCFFGYETPTLLTINEADTNPDDVEDRDDAFIPFFGNSTGISWEIFCPSPPCHVVFSSPVGNYRISYALVPHSSGTSLPTCDGYDTSGATFVNNEELASGGAFNESSTCAELTSSFTTILMYFESGQSGPIVLEVYEGECPTCLEGFDVITLAPNTTLSLTNFEDNVGRLPDEWNSFYSMKYGVVFDIECDAACQFEIASDVNHCFNTIYFSAGSVDSFSCSSFFYSGFSDRFGGAPLDNVTLPFCAGTWNTMIVGYDGEVDGFGFCQNFTSANISSSIPLDVEYFLIPCGV